MQRRPKTIVEQFELPRELNERSSNVEIKSIDDKKLIDEGRQIGKSLLKDIADSKLILWEEKATEARKQANTAYKSKGEQRFEELEHKMTGFLEAIEAEKQRRRETKITIIISKEEKERFEADLEILREFRALRNYGEIKSRALEYRDRDSYIQIQNLYEKVSAQFKEFQGRQEVKDVKYNFGEKKELKDYKFVTTFLSGVAEELEKTLSQIEKKKEEEKEKKESIRIASVKSGISSLVSDLYGCIEQYKKCFFWEKGKKKTIVDEIVKTLTQLNKLYSDKNNEAIKSNIESQLSGDLLKSTIKILGARNIKNTLAHTLQAELKSEENQSTFRKSRRW